MKRRSPFWRSRVARSVFLLFLGCAFVPLLVQAAIATRWVESELIELAEKDLARAGRTAHMTLVENLQHLDRALGYVGMAVREGRALEAIPMEELEATFHGFALIDSGGAVLETSGPVFPVPTVDAAGRRFLREGNALLLSTQTPDGAPALFLVRELGLKGENSVWLAGQLRMDRITIAGQLEIAGAEVLLVGEDGTTLFSSLDSVEGEAELLRKSIEHSHADQFRADLDGREYLLSQRTVFMAPQFGSNWRILYARPQDEVLAPIRRFRYMFVLVLALTLFGVLLLSNRQIQRVLEPIEQLKAGAERLGRHDFEREVEIKTGDEFEELADTFNGMAEYIQGNVRVSEELHALGIALGAEQDSERVIEAVLRGAQAMLDAEMGWVCLATEEHDLEIVRVHVDKQGSLPFDRRCGVQALTHFSIQPKRSIAARVMESHNASLWNDWRDLEGGDLEEEHAFESAFGLRRSSIIAVAMQDHEGELIGVLQLARRFSDRGEAHPFDDQDLRLFEAIAAQTAVAISKNRLLSGFREMMMSMTEVFAMAVDQKSPYTGAHCRRVPELTMMMVESAARANHGSMADFNPGKDELFELQVAALLHDCGKVVTPVHVMDKATKLETIHDRIGLVDLRFDVLERDARIAALEQALRTAGGGGLDEASERELDRRLAELDDDREFLRFSNVGSERMADEDRERVHEIAAKYSLRGPDGAVTPLLNEDETENLTIPFGTLTDAERKVINDHIVVTIDMLEALKYPKALRNVPLIAGTHHERMDGKGYPHGLTRDEIPLGGRIMGIADVFEALTDVDRPYKKGKTLQESLEILGKMASRGHLDPELFELFMDEEIYLRFAEAHMEPERIGSVDFSRIEGYTPKAERYRSAG